MIWTAFVATTRCKLEYGSEVWGDLSSVNADLLESVQHRSLCRVLGVNCKSHRADVCVESFVPPLSVRRDVQLLRYWGRLCASGSPLSAYLRSISSQDRLREKHRASFLERLLRVCSSINLTLDQASDLSKSDLSAISLSLWQRHFVSFTSDTRYRHFKLVQPAVLPPHPVLKSALPRFSTSLFHGLRLLRPSERFPQPHPVL